MRLAELKDRLSSFDSYDSYDSDDSDYASRQVLLYEECLMFFNELDYSIGDPELLLEPEQAEVLEFFLENLQPRAAAPDERVYKYLLEHLTPKIFLSKQEFDKVKNFFYKNLSASKDGEQYYQDPCHLTDLGRLRIYAELMRIDCIYRQKFARVFNADTRLYEPLLSEEVARALYLYM